MKLKRKLLLLILGILLISFCICGFFSVSGFKSYSMAVLVESEKEKLDITAHAFRQVGTREDYEQMGEIARDAYLKYQFKRCYENGYALIKDGTCIVNLTDYEVVDPGALTEEYMVQELQVSNPAAGKKNQREEQSADQNAEQNVHQETGRETDEKTNQEAWREQSSGRKTLQLLIVKRPLEYPEGFEVLAVKDVTPAWKLLERQVYLLVAVFGALMIFASAVTIVSVRYMLRGLEELRSAAGAAADGDLGCVVPIRSGDEIGQVGAAFNRMSKQVQQQVEDLQLLLGALAHEMKTPVTSIIGYADSLLHVRLSERQKEKALQGIYDSGRRMETMSSKLLSLIGMYENDTIEEKTVCFAHVFETVRESTREILKQKGVELLIHGSQDLSVSGDELLLASLFSNLVINSCKASKAGDVIWLEGRGDSGKTVVTVRDTGCGIPEKDIPFVTRAFYMADRSRSRSEGGSGLGLALGMRIAKLHHADLLIASKEGEGTVVTVTFYK